MIKYNFSCDLDAPTWAKPRRAIINAELESPDPSTGITNWYISEILSVHFLSTGEEVPQKIIDSNYESIIDHFTCHFDLGDLHDQP